MQYRVSGVPAGAVPVALRTMGLESGCAAAATGEAPAMMLKATMNALRAISFLLEPA
jgi:hypothetical protein